MENAYKRYLDGDDSALSEIIREYKNGLVLYLNSYVHNLELADELCCETFLKLACKKPKFSGKSSFETFLYAIGRNTALSEIRRKIRRNTEPLDEEHDLPAAADIEKTFFIKERNARIYSAMRRLKAEYSQCLWLMYFEEFSGKEIAAVMKKSEAAVKVLLHRARQALKAELEKEGYTYEDL